MARQSHYIFVILQNWNNRNMRLQRITENSGVLYERAWGILYDSFPESERRQKSSFDKLLRHEKRFHCMCEENAEALLCYWDFTSESDCSPFVYVEYLAVAKALRGKGIGGELMGDFLESTNHHVVLEVEPPVCELTRKRVAFYESLGLRILPDYYMQPSYGVVPGVELKLMVYKPKEKESADILIEQIVRKIHEEVYGVSLS